MKTIIIDFLNIFYPFLNKKFNLKYKTLYKGSVGYVNNDTYSKCIDFIMKSTDKYDYIIIVQKTIWEIDEEIINKMASRYKKMCIIKVENLNEFKNPQRDDYTCKMISEMTNSPILSNDKNIYNNYVDVNKIKITIYGTDKIKDIYMKNLDNSISHKFIRKSFRITPECIMFN